MDDSLWGELRRRKALRFDAPADLRAAAPGAVVKAVGTVRAGEPALRTPFGGRACVAFRVYAVEPTESLVYRPGELELAQPFWLDGASGRTWVHPEGWMRLVLPSRRLDRAVPGVWDAFEAFVARHGLHHRETLAAFALGVPFVERSVEVGSTVAVIGQVSTARRADPRQAGYRGAPDHPVLVPPTTGRLWVSGFASHTTSVSPAP